MEIKLTKETKDIKRTREHSISIKNIENDGVGCEFVFRSVEYKGKTDHLLFPFGKNKWSKTPNKDLLHKLSFNQEILFTILKEFVDLDTSEDQIIVSMTLQDFRYLEESNDLVDSDAIFSEND